MTATSENKGQHYDLIKSHIHPVFADMQLHRSEALRNASHKRERWMIKAPKKALNRISDANLKAWDTQNKTDRLLDRVKNAYAFAEPLLKAKLRELVDIEVDVKNTYLRLYVPQGTPWWVIHVAKGYSIRKVSLLDAALHNFSEDETFTDESAFLLKTDPYRDLYDLSPLDKKITIRQFQKLCRELDLGAQFKAHLESYLLNPEPVAQSYLRVRVQQSQQAALKAAAHMALVRHDITREAHRLIGELLRGRLDLKFHGQTMLLCDLGMMDLNLTGILIIQPAPYREEVSRKMLAWVPHDPDHPLKEYDSTIDFMNELTRQLRENKTSPATGVSYRQFFSQFVDHGQRGHFFADLEQRLTFIKWYPKEPGDSRPSWRETPVDNPRLQFSATPIREPLWRYRYHQQLNKILNDGRMIAVSTADADSNARWAWWENFKKIASDIFNVALLVVSPFVPVLGQLMMAYTAYQLASDVIEGIVDLAEGLWSEATDHLLGVVNDVIQFALIGVGGQLASEFALKLSPLVENMKAVPSADGKTRLWHPDLAPYNQPELAVPSESKPDAKGLHQHAGKTVLPLDDNHYAVKVNPRSGEHRIEHPTRKDAYSPRLRHNGQGAWSHEAETPENWQGPTLMRRLGHAVDGYSDSELEKIRSISGTSEDALRRMHVQNDPPPPLLADTLTRFKTLDEAKDVGRRIRTGQPLPPEAHWFDRTVPDMPGWPADKALKICEHNDLTGASRVYGNPHASDSQTLSIGIGDVMDNKLPERLVAFLDDADMQSLLGSEYPKEQRAQALRDRLAHIANSRTADIFDYQYRFKNRSHDAEATLLQQQYPPLPAPLAETLVEQASADEHKVMDEEQRIPLRLKNQAREIAFEVMTTRANEGLYEPELLTADTERLALNALKFHTDTYENLRIELRNGHPAGELRSSAGGTDAATVRVLVRDRQGRYAVFDGESKQLHGATDFYEALLWAMPEEKRAALGYRSGQGQMFRQWIRVKTDLPAERRTLLAEKPIRPVVPRQIELLVRGANQSREPQTVEDKVRNLYPHFTDAEVERFCRSLDATGDAHGKIDQLKTEYDRLQDILENWRQENLAGWDPAGPEAVPNSYITYERKGGRFLARQLLECFSRASDVFGERNRSLESGYALNLSTDGVPHNLQHWWNQMPEALKPYLEQITSLNLDGQIFSPKPEGLLKDFHHLRQFSARNCGLKALPESVGKMYRLEDLRLNNNPMPLTPATARQVSNLTHLQTLRLDNTPLDTVPYIGRMPRLRILSLRNTGIDSWPPGLFDKPRPREFYLSLGGNQIKYIPEVRPGSDDARLIARTLLYPDWMTASTRSAYERYRQSVGMHPYPVYSTAAADLLERWPVHTDTTTLDETPGVGAYRPEAWHDLASESESEGFFKVLQNLTQSADYLQGGDANDQLTERVWRMVEAADIDDALREKLFIMSTEPEGCEDAGAQLFNNMGIHVLESEARMFSRTPAELESKMVTLAKGKARLSKVGEIAQADIAKRGGNPDEVEVHLAYETGLAKRLELPWQSEAMKFQQVSGVNEETIEKAYAKILAEERGNGLVDQMLEQKFWRDYLEETHPGEMRANTDACLEKIDLLVELQTAQAQWVEAADLPYAERALRRQKVAEIAHKLSIPDDVVFTPQKMSEETIARLNADIGEQEKQLARRLTREAMERAGI
ncbi:hypothetical protein KVQ74_23220 [Pseudomonas sp. COW3]|nr:hypothetical protein [Pseudomonas botevensis]